MKVENGVRFAQFVALGALLGLVGCAEGSISLVSEVEAPVLLGPAQPIGPGAFEVRPLDEDYVYELSRNAGPLEVGGGNLFGTNCVENAEIYTGRYDGILVLVPVSNLWIGVEGEVSQLVPARSSAGEASR